MTAPRWLYTLFAAALAFSLAMDAHLGWSLVTVAHAVGGAVALFAISFILPMLVFDVERLAGRRDPFPFVMWAVAMVIVAAFKIAGS
jgi:hypothetical protein